MNRLQIEVDTEASKLPQSTRVGYAMQDHVPRPRNLAVPPSLSQVSQSDSLVLSQIKAGAEVRKVKDPIIFTAETGRKGMISQASVYGVKVITQSGGGGGSGAGPGTPLAPSGSGGKIGPGLKSVGGSVARLGVGLLLGMLTAYITQKLQEQQIAKQLGAMEPDIQVALHATLPSEDFARPSVDRDRLLRRFQEALGQSAAARGGAP